MVGAHENVGEEIGDALAETFKAQAALVERLKSEWQSNATKTKTDWGGVRYKNGWITGLDGRPIYIESEHAVLVYCLQSDEALMMTYAYILLHDRLLEQGLKWGEDWAYVCWMHK